MVGNSKPHPAAPNVAVGTDGPVSGVGHLLRQARQRAMLDLPLVAEALRIREGYIEAIEDGRFRDLPGPAYAAGFIRSYADFLRLDSEQIVRRFKEEMATLPQPPDLVFPAPVPEGRVPGGAILLIAVMLAVSAYGGWYYLSATDRSIADLVRPLPERFAALLHRQQVAERPDQAETVAAYEPPAPRGAEPRVAETADSADSADSGDASDSVEPPTELVPAGPSGIAAAPPLFATAAPPPAGGTAPARLAGTATLGATVPPAPAAAVGPSSAAAVIASSVPTAAVGPAGTAGAAVPAQAAGRTPPIPPPAVPAEPAGRRFGASTGPSRIVIRATGESWVQVRDGQGRLVMTRVLRPGDSYAVPETPGLRLDTGNAGGLAIEVDGTAIPALGSKGEVIRNIALEAGRLAGGGAVIR